MSRELSAQRGTLLDESVVLTFSELCNTCHVHAELVVQLVEVGVLEPVGKDPLHWRFSGIAILRLVRALNLQRDLDVNLAGVALALELLEEIDRLHERIRLLENK